MKTRVKFSKQILSILLCLAMLMSCVPAFSVMANAVPAEGYNGTPVTPTLITADNYAIFGLTEDNWESYRNYYGIRNAAELYGFAEMANSGQKASGVLLQDIVVNTGTVTESGSSSGTTYHWTPIGTLDNPFGVSFDGNGHTISGLYTNLPDSSYVGLFGVVDGIVSAVISNLTLSNSYFKGKDNVGGIVGYSYGNYVWIDRCKVDATVGVYATESPYPYVGGIIGSGTTFASNSNLISISNCVSLATVKGVNSKSYIGAISGDGGNTNDSLQRFSIEDCYYLAGSATDVNGTAKPGMGYNLQTSGSKEDGCTAIASADASHSCVHVTQCEVKGTCAYTGGSKYSYCLVCGKELNQKITYSVDANCHASNGFTYSNIQKNTHDAYCAACGVFMGTGDHQYDGPTDCINQEACIECGYVGFAPGEHFAADYTYQVNGEDNTKHDVFCEYCNDWLMTEGHSFSGGNCEEPGTCQYCGHSNPADAAKHTGTAVKYSLSKTDNQKHDVLYACCGAFQYSETHTYADGVCQKCSYICSHPGMTGDACGVCGQSSYKYMTRAWDEMGKTVISGTAELSLENYTTVAPTVTTWTSGWYVVSEDVTIEERITVSGDVKLLLRDGSTLTAAKGIFLFEGNSLTIYGQSEDSGALVVPACEDAAAGIGGYYDESGNAGTVTVIGGTVTATGGRFGSAIGGGRFGDGGTFTIYGGAVTAIGGDSASGIGGGECGNGGVITIYGGTVTATGGDSGAGIGGGYSGSYGGVREYCNGGVITIYGGTVTATGGNVAAGIGGGGSGGDGGSITIHGGTVTATGGDSGAGIGGGAQVGQSKGGAGGTVTILDGIVTATGGGSGAGIGGGNGGDGGTTVIQGGTVTATGGNYAAGIGGGSGSAGGTTTIQGGTVTAKGGDSGAGIGGGMRGAGGSVVIQGGTVIATSYDAYRSIGGGWGSNSGTLTISGGNVRALENLSTESGTATDPSQNTLSLVTLYLNGAASGTAVTAVESIGDYGLNDVTTIDNALYFYLPAGTDVAKITAGGKTYFCNRNGTYYTEHGFGYQNITETTHDTCCPGCGTTFSTQIDHDYSDGGVCVCGKKPHSHSWEYSVTGTAILAVCSNADGGCTGTDGGSMQLVAEGGSYTGSPIGAIVEGSFVSGATGKVTYNNGAETAPSAVGTHSATLTVYENGVEKQSVTASYTISQADGSVTNISNIGKTYDGTAVSAPTYTSLSTGAATFEYKVKDADDSTYTDAAPVNAGTYIVRVTVAADANYKEASATAEFTVAPANLEGAVVTLDQDTFVYDGEAHKPDVTVTFNGVTLTEGVDYKVSYQIAAYLLQGKPLTWAGDGTASADCTDAGEYYYAVVEGTGNYYTADNLTLYARFVIEKATVTEPDLGSRPYNGELQYADIEDNAIYSIISQKVGAIPLKYQYTLQLNDPDNYQWSTTDDSTVVVYFEITKAENAWTTAPSISGWTYGEAAGTPVAAAQFGEVKVVYTGTANDGTAYSSETAPTKAGSYVATFTVEDDWRFGGLTQQIDFTVSKATYDMSSAKWNYTNAFKYDGKEHKVEVVGLPNGVTVGGYNGNTATVVGDYTAKVTLSYDAANYNAVSVAELSWKIENNWTPSEYTVSGEGWLNSDLVITANDGYKVSFTDTADGEWLDALTGATEGENSITFYLKNETTGEISLAGTEAYKLDKTPATGKVFFDEKNGWESFLSTITFGLFYKDEVTVKAEAADSLSGVAKIEYYTCQEALSLEDIKTVADWTAMPADGVGVTVEDAKQFVYYIRITDNAGNVTFLSTDGTEYDTTAPVISGIENEKTYYTTQKVTVTDKNIGSITLNGEAATESITLEGDKEATYAIVATDKAGNSTTVTVTVKPISELSVPIDALTKGNVNSGNAQAVDGVKAAVAEIDTANATEEEKAALQQIADKAAALDKVIDNTKAEIARINGKLKKYDDDTVTSEDAAALEQLLADIAKLLKADNLTREERSRLNSSKDTAAELLDKIKNTGERLDKLIGDVSEYSEETVKSTDEAAVEQLVKDMETLLDTDNLTEDEKKALEDARDKAEELLEAIGEAAEAADTENTEKVAEVTAENVTTGDKADLEQAKADLEKALEDKGGNYTEVEKKAIEDELRRIEEALDVIEKVEAVEALIEKLSQDITAKDEVAVKAADDAMCALSDYERSLVNAGAIKKLEDAKAALAELNTPAETPSAKESSKLWLWLVILLVCGGGIVVLIVCLRRKKSAAKE